MKKNCYNSLFLSHPNNTTLTQAAESLFNGDFLQTHAPNSKWGCKYDVQGDAEIDGDMLHCFFDSYERPPEKAYKKLEELGFTVEACWVVDGICGEFRNGKGNYFKLNKLSSYNKKKIPSDELKEFVGLFIES